ncbi:hypothetical protein CONPUDRAFT_98109 [Coniophora puteana RWD-64-598 SS2]|uniref:Telomere length regulation protein conserved domain-containing protein n=1 Tax=Coniophora puteana (strain RWD-64-598) TaxID=741705 RepID=A0A5M3N1Q3_CONPW|nr:uncharacterized protein CONPUDRAFT_98109 [Coniophora puteana RWD-64-598 SS2]EIW85236.1 hypothetical protein CONPUDRAFT_98109 [Coniophora puteana RWD-64-598 SS2]
MAANEQEAQIKDVINRLQEPVPDLPTLLDLLCGPLDALHLLPPPFRIYCVHAISNDVPAVVKHLPALQRAILQVVFPTWDQVLLDENAVLLAMQYFCPDAFFFALDTAGAVALHAFSTILSCPIDKFSVRILSRLAKEYPIDRLHAAVFAKPGASCGPSRYSIDWDDCLKNYFAIPSKVANALEGHGLPQELEFTTYMIQACVRTEVLIYSLSKTSQGDESPDLTSLFIKLANNGLFPSLASSTPVSFFDATLTQIRGRLIEDSSGRYSSKWSSVLHSIPSALTQNNVFTSLFLALSEPQQLLDDSSFSRGAVHREAVLLCQLCGPLVPSENMWETVIAVITSRNWTEGHARIFVCWAAISQKQSKGGEGLSQFMMRILEVWSTSNHIKHSLLSRHQYYTALLALAVSYFPAGSTEVTSVAMSPAFISAIGKYISHLDQNVRRCGMLVAEIVAAQAGKKLDFGDWDGELDGRSWARQLRTLCARRDVDVDPLVPELRSGLDETIPHGLEAEHDPRSRAATESLVASSHREPSIIVTQSGYDSDDSLTGYQSSNSSRSPSPTQSELDELERDPTLRIGEKKILRPVYLAQLAEMVRSPGGTKPPEPAEEVNKLRMALDTGEELIRKKRNYGTELKENAVSLVYGFVGLQDNYDLPEFEIKRQRIANALVACCPQVVAPCVIEEFFKNQYSVQQRYVMLNALAMGARELASLPITSKELQPLSDPKMSFPSKMLPPAAHQKYISASRNGGTMQDLVESITSLAVGKTQDSSQAIPATVMRERQLRTRKPAAVAQVLSSSTGRQTGSDSSKATTFTDVASEYFIMPFINRFWLFLQTERTREERTAHRETLHQYRGAGTGLVLSPAVLTHFLRSLTILIHAAQNAPQWLSIITPNALELALALSARSILTPSDVAKDEDGENGEEDEASVLTSALELVLIVLDGSLDLDRGRSLSLENTTLLLGVNDWAEKVFAILDKGVLLKGGGGAQEIKLRRALSGVLLKINEITSTWGRSMVDIR